MLYLQPDVGLAQEGTDWVFCVSVGSGLWEVLLRGSLQCRVDLGDPAMCQGQDLAGR